MPCLLGALCSHYCNVIGAIEPERAPHMFDLRSDRSYKEGQSSLCCRDTTTMRRVTGQMASPRDRARIATAKEESDASMLAE